MNVFVASSLSAILIVFVTTFIIAFTPLREYIPGYASTQLKKQAAALTIKSDSLLKVTKANNAYIQSVKSVLNGDLEYAKLNKDSIKVAANATEKVDVKGANQHPLYTFLTCEILNGRLPTYIFKLIPYKS